MRKLTLTRDVTQEERLIGPCRRAAVSAAFFRLSAAGLGVLGLTCHMPRT